MSLRKGGNGFFQAVGGGAPGAVFRHGSRSDQLICAGERNEEEEGEGHGERHAFLDLRSRNLLTKL